MNLANRLILSTPGAGEKGGGAIKEKGQGGRKKKKREREIIKKAISSMFDLMNQNTQKDGDLYYRK